MSIEVTAIQARIAQLEQERQMVANRLAELAAEQKDGERLMSAYDGAIGELSRLCLPVDEEQTAE